MKRNTLFRSYILSIIFLVIVFSSHNLNANPLMHFMTSAEWTGVRQLVTAPDGIQNRIMAPPGTYYIYKIRVEWRANFYNPFSLYRGPSPEPVYTGSLIASNLLPTGGVSGYWTWVRYNWVEAGTWYYQATDYSGQPTPNDVLVTVP